MDQRSSHGFSEGFLVRLSRGAEFLKSIFDCKSLKLRNFEKTMNLRKN